MASRWREFGQRFGGGLVGTAAVVPGSAAILVTILYVYRRSGEDAAWISGTSAYVYGTAGAIVLWLVLAFVFRRRLTSVQTANPAVYQELLEHYEGTRSRVDSLVAAGTLDDGPSSRAALDEAIAQLDTCKAELGLTADRPAPAGMDWALATGYAALWRRLHRAQEALLLVEPVCDVVGIGLFDEARLENATIPGRDQLLRQVRTAIGVLDPPSQIYLAKTEDPAKTPDEASGDPSAKQFQARVVLRNTSHVINEFRDDRREGLIRARNNLYRTVFVAGLTGYLLLGLALVREADELSIVAMAAFYLVGAILGLFRQLGQASSIDTVKEGDYGLATARLLHTPLFSGFAAVGGVVLVAVTGALIPANKDPDIPSLRQIFDLGNNQVGLVGAAVFGLAPNLLRQRLQKQAEQYKDDLKSTEASGATSTGTSTS